MKRYICNAIVLLLFSAGLYAQQEKKPVRIADTLTAQEKTTAGRVILRSELDSLIALHNQQIIPVKNQEPETQSAFSIPGYWIAAAVLVLLAIASLLYLLLKNQKRFKYEVTSLNKQLQYLELLSGSTNGQTSAVPKGKKKTAGQEMETKVSDLNLHIDKLKQQNEGLEQLLKEYNGIKQDYEVIRRKIAAGYKVKSYPEYDKTKPETDTLQQLLETEKRIALYAYDHFFKPLIAIADGNKNNPAAMSEDESNKMTDLLVSLSLFYIEYLYLRINDLSFGGSMGERMKNIANGKTIDAASLRKLNREHGSRALVLRMALDRAGVQQLSYPVFDETSLNNL